MCIQGFVSSLTAVERAIHHTHPAGDRNVLTYIRLIRLLDFSLYCQATTALAVGHAIPVFERLQAVFSCRHDSFPLAAGPAARAMAPAT